MKSGRRNTTSWMNFSHRRSKAFSVVRHFSNGWRRFLGVADWLLDKICKSIIKASGKACQENQANRNGGGSCWKMRFPISKINTFLARYCPEVPKPTSECGQRTSSCLQRNEYYFKVLADYTGISQIFATYCCFYPRTKTLGKWYFAWREHGETMLIFSVVSDFVWSGVCFIHGMCWLLCERLDREVLGAPCKRTQHVGQQLPALLDVTCCVRLHTLST